MTTFTLVNSVHFKRSLYLLATVIGLCSCSTTKNTFIGRGYHNLTARFNGYYYSCENIDEGVYKIEKNNKENYDKILPVYIYASPDKVKSTFPEFDKATKKSSLCIQKHAIKDSKGNEIPSAGRWIDNNWINIGISHFYKREFFSAIEAFEYVIRTYTKSDDKFTAMIWLIKANNEIGAVSSSESTLSFLKNQKKLPRKVKRELDVVYADYYVRRGQNTEATARLMAAAKNSNFLFGIPKKKRARYSFIIAQLSEQAKDNNRAIQYYKKTIKLKPNYEMIFYSKIKIARLLDVKRNDSEKTKKDLLKMTKEFKNSDYYDVIYYTLGEIEEKERNIPKAMFYYKKSAQTSVNNASQKALSFLKLGELNFDLTNYQPAAAYYDSAVVTLPNDHPEYNSILARKKTLETLVGYIKTISREDSLQRIARMSEEERNAFIDRMIEELKKEEERKKREAAAALLDMGSTSTITTGGGTSIPDISNTGASFYFYNPNTVALGVTDFTKKWGNRKLEDNWRRSNKALSLEEESEYVDDRGAGKDTSKSNVKSRGYYLVDIPLTDSLMKKSNTRLIRAYYLMGTLYKEELHNTKKSGAALEELNKRFPENKYALNSYYMLYRIYLQEKNQVRADFYKNKILNEFPDSEFALLIKNPGYAEELNAQKSEVESFYAITYKSYREEDFSKSYDQSKEAISKFGKNDYLPKFEFIKAMSLGKLQGIDTLEKSLKLLTAKYPNAEVTPLANDILLAIKKQRNPELFKPIEKDKKQLDTFSVNMNAEHFVAVILPDDPKVVEAFKANLGNFNNTYYSEKKFTITTNLFGGKQLLVIKSFTAAREALNYYDNLNGDPDVYKGDVKKEMIEVYPILTDNLPILYQKKSAASYKLFFEDNYKKLNSKN